MTMTRWLFLFCCAALSAHGQDTLRRDSSNLLSEVVVKAFAYNRTLKETPVSLGLVGQRELNRFSPVNILSAVNAVPGVRMEERSPGSYRFSIRGSTIRSPFGVRDVKFYWNGLPLTDGGGNTYLNLLDFDVFGRAEIIKGPGASLYGAGTGGVVLLTSPLAVQRQLQFSTSGGSFGLQRYQASAVVGGTRKKFFFNYAHQQSDGYRQQTAMRRDALHLEGNIRVAAQSTLQTSLFYTDLFYQTPGGLTATQYAADPHQARPPSKTTFGAVQQQAAIYNKTIFGGLVYETQWNKHASTRAGLYQSYTDYTNPSILNYERRTEYNFGGRTDTQFSVDREGWQGKFTAGAEWQHFYSPLTDYGNRRGVKDSVQTDDRLTSNIVLFFVQAEAALPHQFYLTAGGSVNLLRYQFNRLAGLPPGQQARKFDPVFSPRVALLKKFSESLSAFASVSKGFSAPSLAEVRPSSGVYNNSLSPEQGINYETGLRGKLWNALSFDMALYDFEMSQAIVSENIGAYYVNAGNTSQKGWETYLSWQSARGPGLVSSTRLWGSYTLAHYRFVNYAQNGVNYSGKQWTGTAPNTLVAGGDFYFQNNFYWNLTASWTDRIPLNDANSAYAADYFLLGSRVGWRSPAGKKTLIEIFGGVDNALNQKYSLGNDLNAAAGRYFNAAATRNFYVGLKVTPRLLN